MTQKCSKNYSAVSTTSFKQTLHSQHFNWHDNQPTFTTKAINKLTIIAKTDLSQATKHNKQLCNKTDLHCQQTNKSSWSKPECVSSSG